MARRDEGIEAYRRAIRLAGPPAFEEAGDASVRLGQVREHFALMLRYPQQLLPAELSASMERAAHAIDVGAPDAEGGVAEALTKAREMHYL